MDQELRNALRRKPAPEGFAARMLERAAGGQKPDAARRPFRMQWAIAAGLAVIAMSGAWSWREMEQQRRGEQAKEQTLAALRLTSEKVQLARHRIQKVNHGVNQ